MIKKPITGQVRVGLIGAGLIGQTHSMMLRKVADFTDGSARITAIADVSPDAAQTLAARWPGARALSSAAEIIDDPEIDAVWICTPTAMHREACVAAAQAGKHVFCEKPLAMNAAEAAAMMHALEANQVQSQVGLVLRFSPVYTVIRAMVREPEAGRLIAITLRDDQDFPIRGAHPSAWRNDPAVTAGGTLVEHSVHDFDLLRWMFGEPVRVFCRTRNLRGAAGVEDFAATHLEFTAGHQAQHTSVWHRVLHRASNRRLEVFCENLFIACDTDASGPIIIQRGDDRREAIIPEQDVMARFAESLLRERPYLAPLRDWFAVGYALEDAVFIAGLRGACEIDPGFGEGVKAQRIVETAYESARRGVPLDIGS
ncbi:MAG TPA: Gfo/Idh/MocA family oxidoreductase [Candidatus Binataceae bacterium]|nr:Gfo/Idh/MocA family oxidoreductase [Candidatus Binataceae bacterium]